jgi:hypothetical protein
VELTGGDRGSGTQAKVRQHELARQKRTGKSLRWKLHQDMVAAHTFHHVVSDTQEDGGEILDLKRPPKHSFCWSTAGLIIVRRKRFFLSGRALHTNGFRRTCSTKRH